MITLLVLTSSSTASIRVMLSTGWYLLTHQQEQQSYLPQRLLRPEYPPIWHAVAKGRRAVLSCQQVGQPHRAPFSTSTPLKVN